jgi:hypothetical protein
MIKLHRRPRAELLLHGHRSDAEKSFKLQIRGTEKKFTSQSEAPAYVLRAAIVAFTPRIANSIAGFFDTPHIFAILTPSQTSETIIMEVGPASTAP